MMVILAYVWTDDLQLTLTIGLFSISNFFVFDYQWSMCTMLFSSSSCIPVQCLLLNSFWMMFSLTLAYFPPFQTILSEVSIRFYLLRDVNLSVCLKWWLTFDTDNPVVFVISQASIVLRLHTLVFAWVSRARLVLLFSFLLNSVWINCSLPLACFLLFQTFLSNVLSRF